MNFTKECYASTSTQHLHSATVSGKGKRKMCESELPQPLSPPKSTPHFQPHSPKTSILYGHRLVRGTQANICFRCHREGHWMRDCPLNSPNSKSRAPIPENSDFPKIYCRYGHGVCEIRTAENDRNYGRSYYVCPIISGKKCQDFVKWCDDPVDESDLRPRPYAYPKCSCGAGVCRKIKETSSPNEGRYFIACPIRKGHGGCDFQLWEDPLLGTPNIAPVQQSSQRTHQDYSEGSQVDKINIIDLDEDGDSLLGHSERMRITGDSDYFLAMAVSELPEGEDAVPKEAQIERRDHDETTELSTAPHHVDFPVFEAAVDLLDIDKIISVSSEAFKEKALSIFHLSTPSMIHDLSLEDRIQRYEEEKVRLTNIHDNYVKTKALFEVSQQRSQSLQEEASRLKATLQEIEDQLTSCKLETKRMETCLGEINASMMEAEESIKIAAEQASSARKLSKEGDAKQIVVKLVLKDAKLELG